jgi:hypothetical protein
LLSTQNIKALEDKGYEYILGARIKNESEQIKKQIVDNEFSNGQTICINKSETTKLIVAFSNKRAAKDQHNRNRGLQRLEKQIRAGKLTKSNINNRGYNKYLKMEGEISIAIDYEKYHADAIWDGLKGYITNARLTNDEVIENYKSLWNIERAFRMSKTDLRIRPIYHRLRNRIEAHICISFTAYCIYKELERILKLSKSTLSVKRSVELTHNMYQISYMLPQSKHTKSILLQMDDEQAELYKIVNFS